MCHAQDMCEHMCVLSYERIHRERTPEQSTEPYVKAEWVSEWLSPRIWRGDIGGVNRMVHPDRDDPAGGAPVSIWRTCAWMF